VGEANTGKNERVLIIGRSPSVLLDAADILRGKGFRADATNQFDEVLREYDAAELDVVVFGGMVPPNTKHHLEEEISKVNGHVTFVQGLVGIAGVIAAQVEGVRSAAVHGRSADGGSGDGGADGMGGDGSADGMGGNGSADGMGGDGGGVSYGAAGRAVRVVLPEPALVVVEAWWVTSFAPPEPTSTSLRVIDSRLEAGDHSVPLPAEVPVEASFVTVSVGTDVYAFAVGAMPEAVTRMVPTGGSAKAPALPPVKAVATHHG
jgi:hypothetical protein